MSEYPPEIAKRPKGRVIQFTDRAHTLHRKAEARRKARVKWDKEHPKP